MFMLSHVCVSRPFAKQFHFVYRVALKCAGPPSSWIDIQRPLKFTDSHQFRENSAPIVANEKNFMVFKFIKPSSDVSILVKCRHSSQCLFGSSARSCVCTACMCACVIQNNTTQLLVSVSAIAMHQVKINLYFDMLDVSYHAKCR